MNVGPDRSLTVEDVGALMDELEKHYEGAIKSVRDHAEFYTVFETLPSPRTVPVGWAGL